MVPPNGLPFSRAALIDRNDVRVLPDAKIAPASSTRSGVGCNGGLGGHALMDILAPACTTPRLNPRLAAMNLHGPHAHAPKHPNSPYASTHRQASSDTE